MNLMNSALYVASTPPPPREAQKRSVQNLTAKRYADRMLVLIKSHMYGLSISTDIDDLEWPWTVW